MYVQSHFISFLIVRFCHGLSCLVSCRGPRHRKDLTGTSRREGQTWKGSVCGGRNGAGRGAGGTWRRAGSLPALCFVSDSVTRLHPGHYL